MYSPYVRLSQEEFPPTAISPAEEINTKRWLQARKSVFPQLWCGRLVSVIFIPSGLFFISAGLIIPEGEIGVTMRLALLMGGLLVKVVGLSASLRCCSSGPESSSVACKSILIFKKCNTLQAFVKSSNAEQSLRGPLDMSTLKEVNFFSSEETIDKIQSLVSRWWQAENSMSVLKQNHPNLKKWSVQEESLTSKLDLSLIQEDPYKAYLEKQSIKAELELEWKELYEKEILPSLPNFEMVSRS